MLIAFRPPIGAPGEGFRLEGPWAGITCIASAARFPRRGLSIRCVASTALGRKAPATVRGRYIRRRRPEERPPRVTKGRRSPLGGFLGGGSRVFGTPLCRSVTPAPQVPRQQ